MSAWYPGTRSEQQVKIWSIKSAWSVHAVKGSISGYGLNLSRSPDSTSTHFGLRLAVLRKLLIAFSTVYLLFIFKETEMASGWWWCPIMTPLLPWSLSFSHGWGHLIARGHIAGIPWLLPILIHHHIALRFRSRGVSIFPGSDSPWLALRCRKSSAS